MKNVFPEFEEEVDPIFTRAEKGDGKYTEESFFRLKKLKKFKNEKFFFLKKNIKVKKKFKIA